MLARAGRPTGKARNPGTILAFGIATLGLYAIVSSWQVRKEVDASPGRRGARTGS